MIHLIGTIGRDLHVEDHVLAVAKDVLYARTEGREISRKPAVVDRDVDEFAKPVRRDFHVSCELLASSC
jgi:hypothetical protein